MTYLLEMKDMTKKYGALFANKDIYFSLKKGEVHAIIGENGAGKTTLMRMLYGMEQADSGEIFVDGKQVNFQSPSDAIDHGIGMVHQHFMLFPYLTVTENIVIGREPKKLGLFKRKDALQKVNALAEQYRIPLRPLEKVVNCSMGEQQKIEIIKVLYQGADIIILDEPTAVLTPLEVKELVTTIRFLASEGKSVIIITHKLQEVLDIADRVTVLRNGQITGSMPIQDVSAPLLAKLMVGRDLKEVEDRKPMNGEPFLKVNNILIQERKNKPVLNNVSLHVAQGEIVGIAGVSGNGQSELIEAISGLTPIQSGSIYLGETEITSKNVRERRDAGLSHIPEDRYKWGAAKDASVEENAIMGYHRKKKYSKMGLIQSRALRTLIENWITHYSIKTSSIKQNAESLSGGNMQKLIVARELGQQKPFLIAAEPTRGVDIGAMEVIHEALIEKRNEGGSILLISSELSEIIKLSDRVIVMYEGEIAGEMLRSDVSEERISILMAGGKTEYETS